MPAGDGTGPEGVGPMTGRGAGFCAGYEAPGYVNSYPRMGMAWRRGRGGGGGGHGWRHVYYATGLPRWARGTYGPGWGTPPAGLGFYGGAPSRQEQTEYLKAQAEWLREQLGLITDRIADLEREG